jgi:hypothetical protein
MLQRHRSSRNRCRAEHDDGRMTQREHEANCDRAFSILHQLARHVVDRGYMIRIDCMTQAKAISEKRSSQQHRVTVKSDSPTAMHQY